MYGFLLIFRGSQRAHEAVLMKIKILQTALNTTFEVMAIIISQVSGVFMSFKFRY